MHEMAARVFRANLNGAGGATAREYLAKRAVAPAVAEEFGLGYADRSGQDLARRLEREGLTPEQMEASGLVLKRQDGSGFFDRFRGRLMFPIHSESGKIIGFGGRVLSADDEPKYLNSPETAIYRKSHVLYNLHRAKDPIRKHERAILVEGYMDVIGLHGAGVREVVASCGTALTSFQVRAIKRHSEKIVVNFDPDVAGASRGGTVHPDAARRKRASAGARTGGRSGSGRVCEGARSGSLPREGGESAGLLLLAGRPRARPLRHAHGPGPVAALQFLLPAIQRVSDKLERAAIADDVASYLGVEPGLVLDHFKKAAMERREKPLETAASRSGRWRRFC